MKHTLLSICFLASATVAGAQANGIPATGKSVADFIPKGYDTLQHGMVSGDLNKDGLADVALALYSQVESADNLPDSLPPRLLVILFKTSDGYKLAGFSDKAILCKQCGGVFGDPFSDLSISAKGVLGIDHYGGSIDRWSYNEKFRYQDDHFFLIGSTSDGVNVGRECPDKSVNSEHSHQDNNWLTGDEQISQTDEKCKLIKNVKHKINVTPLVSLEKYQGVQQ